MKFDKLFKKHKTVVIVILFFIALAPRLYKIDNKSAWLDESRQAGLSGKNPFDLNLAHRASRQQQPPLDYFVQSIMITNYGLNEVGIRVHAAIFGALAAVLFFLLLQQIIDNYPALLLGTLAFVFHPYLILYSQEARPISGAVFFCLLYLYVLVIYFQRDRTNRHSILPFVILTVAQAGFLLSVGFQPIIFLVVSSIALTPNLFIKERRSRVFHAYLSSALALLISFPIINMSIISGASLHLVKYNSLFDMLKNLTQGIDHLYMNNLLQYFRIIFKDYGLFFIVAIAAGTIGFIFNSEKKRFIFALSYFFVFLMAYPVIYTIIFKSLVSWQLFPRYYLTFTPVCLAAMTLAVGLAFNLASSSASLFKPLKHLLIVALIALFMYSFVSNARTVSRFYKVGKSQWKKLYNVFKYHSEPGDIAYMLNLVKINRSAPYFTARELYYPKDKVYPVRLKHARSIPNDLKDSKLWENEKNIYVVTSYGSRKIKKEFLLGRENVETFRIYNISLIRVKVSPGTREDFVSVLRVLKRKLPRKESNYLLYEILIKIDLNNGNIEKAKKNIDMLAAMSRKKSLNDLIQRLKKRLEALERKKQAGF